MAQAKTHFVEETEAKVWSQVNFLFYFMVHVAGRFSLFLNVFFKVTKAVSE